MQTKLKEHLVDCLTKYFKENLVSVVFFGSRARREAKPESDYDIFLVANELPKRILDRQSHVRKAISFKFEQKISIHAKTKAEFERGFPPLYLDLGLDGQILYDTANYMHKKINRIQEITKDSGLYRVKRNGGHVWEWKRQPGPYWSVTWGGFYDGTR